MNPYDFVRVDWSRPPERHKPMWHHRLVGQDGQRLYAGQIEVDVFAETPLFIPERNASQDPKKPAQFIQNRRGEYIIPGSSLKGMLRCLVETLGNGCFTLFDGKYEPIYRDRRQVGYEAQYEQMIPASFHRCGDNTNLCIACRTFGMLKERTSGVFLGKVNIGDACTYEGKVYKYDPIYTAPLVEPKPHHSDFYLDKSRQHIEGRKYYFHHPQDKKPLTEKGPVYFSRDVLANRYIQPLDIDTQFPFRVDFTNLEAEEFAALLLAITLEENMRHKIGYGKPLGLGSIYLVPTSITMVDYSTRYTQREAGNGKMTVEGDAMWELVDEHVAAFSKTQLVQVAMEDLRRIWRWPPDPTVDYYYPSKRDWFDTEDSIGKRIADTRDVP